jgi:OOP family OmpA-OmpF porin
MKALKMIVAMLSLSAAAVLMACASTTNVSSQDDPQQHIYWRGTDGQYARGIDGNCVRTIRWNLSAATHECDPNLVAKSVAAAAPAPTPKAEPVAMPAPAATPAIERVTLTSDALFDFDKADLRPEGKSKLDAVAAKIKGDNINVDQITVTGHASAIGEEAYNQALSERRAAAVKAYLIENGIDSSRIVTLGMGERQPAASNSTPEGRAQNRRVEVDVKAHMMK